MLWKMAILHLILCIIIKREDVSGLHCDRLGRRETAKWRNLWDWIENKMINTFLFYIGGYRIVTVNN